MKCLERELFKKKSEMFYNLFYEEPEDKLKFVFRPDVILCG